MENEVFRSKDFLLYKKHMDISYEEFIKKIPADFRGLIFRTIDRDTKGNSGGNPRWGEVFEFENGKMTKKGTAIYKEPDYDATNGPYAEKMWSILGKMVLPNCKVPDIDIINDERYRGMHGVLSYSIVETNKEDMMDIRDLLRYNGISEKDMRANDDKIYIEDLLGYINDFLNDEESYKKLEADIIKTILLDCMTNSLDRHPDNWALIFNNQTGECKVGLFDHTVSFINMIEPRPGVVLDGNWGDMFIKVNKNNQSTIFSKGNQIVEYIHDNYSEYFKDFKEKFNNSLEEFYDIIGREKYRNIVDELTQRKRFLRSLDKEDKEL